MANVLQRWATIFVAEKKEAYPRAKSPKYARNGEALAHLAAETVKPWLPGCGKTLTHQTRLLLFALDEVLGLGDLDGHLEVDGEGDFLRAAEGGGAEAGGAAYDRADGRAFAAIEECTHQGSCACAEAGADESGSSFAGGEDCAFDAEGFVRGSVVELDDFGVDAGGASVEHDESIELEDHLGASLEAAGDVDGTDVPVDAGSLVGALRDDGGAERIVDLGVGGGEGVVEAETEGYVLGDGEGWRCGECGQGDEGEKEGDDGAGIFRAKGDEIQRRPFVFPDGVIVGHGEPQVNRVWSVPDRRPDVRS
jgi:hypothetical protein